MKLTFKAVVVYSLAAISGTGLAAQYCIYHNRQLATEMVETCKARPALQACIDRRNAIYSVAFFFNGIEARDRGFLTALDSAK